MKNKHAVLWVLAVVIIAGVGFFFWKRSGDSHANQPEEIRPERRTVEKLITTTATVQPQNRLEIMPPVSGRVEDVLVVEGQMVKKGDIVAWMSSTERAALLDAARSKDESALSYWEDAYKPTPLMAPIDGQVIVRSVEPGQTVTSAAPVVVLSDRLIVKAQVDESDIGRVKVGQKARVSLDAYPSVKILSRVDHIAYESEIVNNVTIYNVDILPDSIDEMFRSGMSANVQIVESVHENVLTLPSDAVQSDRLSAYVLVRDGKSRDPLRRNIETGLDNGDFVEIVSGLAENETVVLQAKKGIPPKNKKGSSPLMPSHPRSRR